LTERGRRVPATGPERADAEPKRTRVRTSRVGYFFVFGSFFFAGLRLTFAAGWQPQPQSFFFAMVLTSFPGFLF